MFYLNFKSNCILFFGHFLFVVRRGISYLIRQYERSKLLCCGSNSYIGHHCLITYPTVSIGCHSYIGSNCVIQNTTGKIYIGNHVMFGPGVNVHGGDHIVNQVGVFMNEVKKPKGYDGDVIIDDEVWCGANVIILGGKNGIKIGRGAVIGAGSIVTKDVPPYSIVVGNPGKVIKKRFTYEQIVAHEKALYRKQG